MSNVLNSVDQRTKLVGKNRLELLLFKINATQLFAINVFKVREVVKLPKLNALPGSHPHIEGVATIRGVSIPVIDLRKAIGFTHLPEHQQANLIITEYNRTVQGFLVGDVERIINMTWEDILPPPKSVGKSSYLTAITRIDHQGSNRLVSIIDVEKVLAEIIQYDVSVSQDVLDAQLVDEMIGRKVFVVDDSATARHLIIETLAPLGIEIIEASDGLQALTMLKRWQQEGKHVADEILMMISDAEMPEMDGYKLVHEIRADDALKNLHVVLNTSLSGSFNNALAEKVGFNRFISKFQPDALVEAVQDRLREIL
ncbi:chemotaxis protein CheV [Parashewanella curva]|uniref:Chemotaxis protein CheV n=1 Tax=Parashewanella curva TaxID=2338552 RepID=A0A3L8Q0Q0_9GAMM|nr:chemotaxis protein CheV [Parashewanella curva]RLV60629.1 chemotaxis protein CheV [Parashewanella curva]